ncbi:YdiU family protein [Salinimicrobium catena]|uniref:protein adenylyltransferase SelO n=1 Tax=Salinimicrobium catena TaxID=390640 RepID=UPI002FE4AAFE
MERLSEKKFRNDFVTRFEGDDSGDRTPRHTPGMLYSKAEPTPVPEPKLLAWSKELAADLELADPKKEDIDILAGNRLTKSMYPYAACYAGHQFGNWAGQLGDGRAITLGEIHSQKGRFELQLKGAGPTAYSRRADGRAVLRSSVREYLISEAMYFLGVPTTRALSLVSTGEKVLRDMFYNGNAEYEPGAITTRVAPSFLRFGNFEALAAQKDRKKLQKLVDWTIAEFYPHIKGEDPVLTWFEEVVLKTANLMVEWQRVGFVHGVMNTDNMSILGLTIDYGPFSFLDDYDHNFTPNTTDLPGRRYAFGNQPSIAYWNLGKLANAISILFDDLEPLEEALNSYEEIFWNAYYGMMGKKLGLDKVTLEDKELITQFEKVLSSLQPDMTLFYRLLVEVSLEEKDFVHHFSSSFYRELNTPERGDLKDLMENYIKRISKNSIPRKLSAKIMNRNNPRIILRNYLLHQAIEDLEKGDNKRFLRLQEAMKVPYAAEGFDELVQKRPEWATNKAGCSMLSCSS